MSFSFEDLQMKYHHWLHQLSQSIAGANTEQVKQLLQLEETLKAYWHTGEQMAACDTQLFIETFLRQAQSAEQPEFWPETLWYELSFITDKTQLQWLALPEDLAHQGIYRSDEQVGMGWYQCCTCQQSMSFYHPALLSECPACGHREFIRRGLPDDLD